MRTIEWKNGIVTIIDQTRLPNEKVLLKLSSCKEMASAIKNMKVRGAPLIGASAAYGLALKAYHSKALNVKQFLDELKEAALMLKKTRPTAINLFWAIDRVLSQASNSAKDIESARKKVIEESKRIADEDIEINHQIGNHGSQLIDNGDIILTHCNAGGLATVEYGTALAVVRRSFEQGKKIQVIAAETRPRFQGSKLTAYELMQDGIPVTLITDSMVGHVMSKGMVNKVIVGADRIVDDAVINKIGTYSVAVLAREHKIPFYVAAPTSTFNLGAESKNITIEERPSEEVTRIGNEMIAPIGVKVLNPAFDITPLEYVSAIISEKGVITDPYKLLKKFEQSENKQYERDRND